MRLISLKLEHFRTYPALSAEFADGSIHLLLGQNGAGKTNLLEAISVLSLTRSLRGSDDDDLRTWGSDHYRVQGQAETDSGQLVTLETVSVSVPRRKRACFINDVQKPVGEYAGVLPTVAFLPEDLGLFRGPPAERRRFLDQVLCQVSQDYMRSLSSYQQVLKQRNTLLRSLRDGGDPESLTPWEKQMAEYGSVLTLLRLELLNTINLTLRDELTRLGEKWDDPVLRYERETTVDSQEALAEELKSLFLKNRARDREMLSTSVGPHREDWQLFADNRPVPTWASRGQERIALIALLLLQVAYVELRRGERPIILLDDVLSELDSNHQNFLLQSLHGHQILLSGTHQPSDVESLIVWNVTPGSLKRA